MVEEGTISGRGGVDGGGFFGGSLVGGIGNFVQAGQSRRVVSGLLGDGRQRADVVAEWEGGMNEPGDKGLVGLRKGEEVLWR